MKSILAIFAGIITGLTILFLGMMVFKSVFPFPAEMSIRDDAAYQLFIESFDRKAYIIKIISNSAAVFLGGLVASIIGRSWRLQSGVLTVLPFLVYIIYNDFMYEYPTLYVVLNISLAVIAAFLSILFGSTRVISN